VAPGIVGRWRQFGLSACGGGQSLNGLWA